MQHSKIGPSALHRLLACPGSYQLSERLPVAPDAQRRSSYAAAEGTVAHSIVEAFLKKDTPHEFGNVVVEEGHPVTIDEDMIAGTAQMIAFCESLAEDASEVLIEEQVDLGFLWYGKPPEPIFGTVDFAAYHPKTDALHVVDFKYGRLPVSPYDNAQASAYGIGACHQLGLTPETVTVTIIQPRRMDNAPPVQTDVIAGLDLMVWAEDVMKDGVDALFGASPELATGDHCRFCPAKLACPAMKQLAQDTAKTEFPGIPPEPVNMSNDDLGLAMDQAAVLQMWFKEIQAETSGRVERGEAVPNWKLVPKRAARKWTDEKEVASQLNDPRLFIKKPLSPTQMEKKEPVVYRAFVERGLMSNTSSGTTLVPDKDPRDAVEARTASDDFDEVL